MIGDCRLLDFVAEVTRLTVRSVCATRHVPALPMPVLPGRHLNAAVPSYLAPGLATCRAPSDMYCIAAICVKWNCF